MPDRWPWRLDAGDGIYFYVTSVNRSRFYTGKQEYHGFFAYAPPDDYIDQSSPQKDFTFVAKNKEDLKMLMGKGAANEDAMRELHHWLTMTDSRKYYKTDNLKKWT